MVSTMTKVSSPRTSSGTSSRSRAYSFGRMTFFYTCAVCRQDLFPGGPDRHDRAAQRDLTAHGTFWIHRLSGYQGCESRKEGYTRLRPDLWRCTGWYVDLDITGQIPRI
jgi:cytochrome c5